MSFVIALSSFPTAIKEVGKSKEKLNSFAFESRKKRQLLLAITILGRSITKQRAMQKNQGSNTKKLEAKS